MQLNSNRVLIIQSYCLQRVFTYSSVDVKHVLEAGFACCKARFSTPASYNSFHLIMCDSEFRRFTGLCCVSRCLAEGDFICNAAAGWTGDDGSDSGRDLNTLQVTRSIYFSVLWTQVLLSFPNYQVNSKQAVCRM